MPTPQHATRDGQTYDWAILDTGRTAHLMTWGRKLLCGQPARSGRWTGDFVDDYPKCQVCLRIARAQAEGPKIQITLTQSQVNDLLAIIGRAERAYQSDIETYTDLAKLADREGWEGHSHDNANYSKEQATKAKELSGAITSETIRQTTTHYTN